MNKKKFYLFEVSFFEWLTENDFWIKKSLHTNQYKL